MSVLLVAEHDNSKLKPFTFNAITAASKIDSDVHVLSSREQVVITFLKKLQIFLWLKKF